MNDPSNGSFLFPGDIATAPGDLPMPEIQARLAARETQFRHDNTICPAPPQPGKPVQILATSGTGMPIAHAAVLYTTDGSRPEMDAATVTLERGSVEWEPRGSYLTHWQATIPGQPAGTTVRYRLAGWYGEPSQALEGHAPPDIFAQDGQGFWFRFPAEQGGVSTFAYRVEPAVSALPEWVRDAVIYQIFLDRFHPGTEDGSFVPQSDQQARHGGNLRGVTQALPYLSELGVTCLWLSPISPSETYHRYDAVDLYDVDPELGGSDDLHALVREAHRRGMRVILDFVPAHCSWHHPAFLAAQRDRTAPSAAWFTFNSWPDDYRSFLQHIPHLPSFNTEDPGARAHIIGGAVHWLRDYGIDGFRLDHAIGPGMDFWVAFRNATREAAPDSFTVGEATDTPDSLRRYRGRLDAILDFPLATAFRLFFGSGAWGIGKFDAFLRSYDTYMASGPGRVTFLDNHDMNRFLFVADNRPERLKLAALCQFALPAPPTIYYGTEIGLSQEHDKETAGFGGDALVRADMPWQADRWKREVLDFYRLLIKARGQQVTLRRGTRRTIHLDERLGTYAFSLSTDTLDRTCLALFNFSGETRDIDVTMVTKAPSLSLLVATGVEAASIHGCTVRLLPASGALLTSE